MTEGKELVPQDEQDEHYQPNALAIYQNFDTLQRAALALHKSGYFNDARSEAQAIVKVMAGAELGLPPFASMTGIHIIKGKPTLGSNVIATLVKNDPRYDYHIKHASDEACILEWYENGERVGEAGFTIEEARNAGLANKDNWKNYTSDMLFARAVSRGARRYAPGIFGGSPVYTPDEMGVDTDEEGYIDVEAIEVEEKPKEETEEEPEDDSPKVTRPYEPERVKEHLHKVIKRYEKQARVATEKQRKALPAWLSKMFPEEKSDVARHAVTHWLTGRKSSKDLTSPEVLALIKWIDPDDENNPNQLAIAEAKKILRHIEKEQGQQELL